MEINRWPVIAHMGKLSVPTQRPRSQARLSSVVHVKIEKNVQSVKDSVAFQSFSETYLITLIN